MGILKGSSGQIRSALAWYHCKDLAWFGHRSLYVKKNVNFDLEFLKGAQSFQPLNTNITPIP